jgi:hypothetical protein
MAGKPKSHHEGTKNTKKSETKKSVDNILGNCIQGREKSGTPFGSALYGEGGILPTSRNTPILSRDSL